MRLKFCKIFLPQKTPVLQGAYRGRRRLEVRFYTKKKQRGQRRSTCFEAEIKILKIVKIG